MKGGPRILTDAHSGTSVRVAWPRNPNLTSWSRMNHLLRFAS
ncbi:hypothetical protein QO014_002663 [Kaistia dalseonensis]|uniref:Uncharacterized protein n=1 Tax=Kaistia dalseonensis TaxID=410840 RepID=A0ABU0H7K0_9HYPH|nr:hypothetical protein [Kaistia dalseonensis]